ncbi:hypothetical protein LO80_09225 [Candidatus Francisella endociliophora]|uniref:Uncharacterized protein n=1 Tax=Candidatus Francisella endociliophora TaxID=653937 RepID=A0A097ERF1_9GAMM|nr:hypothetical protein [Francisella sp. FSC1006]AIT10134.1 hypothetical protein LO80_09225 [Francisella sp. FSC1006]
MSIKIHPEKASSINNHRTRKKITNSTYAYKELISKASHLSTTIEVANKELQKFNLPYLCDTHVVFYSPKKIIVQSDKEILKTKFKELQSQFVSKLRQSRLFSKLEKIEIIIDYKTQTKKPQKVSDTKLAKQALNEIKKEICKE